MVILDVETTEWFSYLRPNPKCWWAGYLKITHELLTFETLVKICNGSRVPTLTIIFGQKTSGPNLETQRSEWDANHEECCYIMSCLLTIAFLNLDPWNSFRTSPPHEIETIKVIYSRPQSKHRRSACIWWWFVCGYLIVDRLNMFQLCMWWFNDLPGFAQLPCATLSHGLMLSDGYGSKPRGNAGTNQGVIFRCFAKRWSPSPFSWWCYDSIVWWWFRTISKSKLAQPSLTVYFFMFVEIYHRLHSTQKSDQQVTRH